MCEHDTDGAILSAEEVRLLESDVLHVRIHRVTPLRESVQNKAIRLHTDVGDFTLTENIRGNSAPVEAALMRRVAPLLPVPEPVYADDGELLGWPFVAKRFVSGQTVSSVLAGTSTQEAMDIATAVGGVLAAIGTVGFDRPGVFTGTDLEPGNHPDFDLLALPQHVVRRLEQPVVAPYLDKDDRERLLDVVTRDAAVLTAVRDEARLVHSDFNGKNIVVRCDDGHWRVSAVLDWEFAFSGPPLADVANHLRCPEDLPDSYRDCFLASFTGGGGVLGEDWERIARVLDMFALVDFLAAGPGHVLFERTLRRMREVIARGSL